MGILKNAPVIANLIDAALSKFESLADSSSKRTIAEKEAKAGWDIQFDKERHAHELAILAASPEYAMKRMEQRYQAELKRMEQRHEAQMAELAANEQVRKIEVVEETKQNEATSKVLTAVFSLEPIVGIVSKVVDTVCSVVGEIDGESVTNKLVDGFIKAEDDQRKFNQTMAEAVDKVVTAKKVKEEEPKNGTSKMVDTTPMASGNIGAAKG